jgi:hypothetical protein
MLLDAGATLHVKTTVPTGLLALETDSDLYGYCTNPYNSAFTSGASTGGGAALLAYGGSKIEIGSDFGGSVRVPAHFSGLYSIKASHGRFPETGMVSFCPGLQGIPLVTSPMAQDLEDLTEFCHRFVDLKPWIHCHTVSRVSRFKNRLPMHVSVFLSLGALLNSETPSIGSCDSGCSGRMGLRHRPRRAIGLCSSPSMLCGIKGMRSLISESALHKGVASPYREPRADGTQFSHPPNLLHGIRLALQIAFCAGCE